MLTFTPDIVAGDDICRKISVCLQEGRRDRQTDRGRGRERQRQRHKVPTISKAAKVPIITKPAKVPTIKKGRKSADNQ